MKIQFHRIDTNVVVGLLVREFCCSGTDVSAKVLAMYADTRTPSMEPQWLAAGLSQGRDLIEIPAGGFERGEEGLEVAKRELLEETGYSSDDWQFIGRTVESSAKLTNYMHIYFADHCRKVSGQHLDATEEIEVLVMPLEQAVSMVMDNEICCNSSAHGILWAARKYGI